MGYFYTLIITSIAGFATLLGNILLFLNVKYKNKTISFVMGLSFSVMFLLSVLELIPDGIELLIIRYNVFYVFIVSILLLVLGYMLVNYLDNVIDEESSLYKVGLLSMFSLFLHNIPEGILCALTSSRDFNFGIKMCFLIMIHNIPEGICISLPIYYSTGSRGKAFFMSIISSFGELFGALISIIFLNNYINDLWMAIIYIITGGIMITLSIKEIFIEGIRLKYFKAFLSGILIGMIIITVTL